MAGAIPIIVIGVYVLSFVGFYFSVGLAACADMIFRGQEATVSDGLAVSRTRIAQISGWAAVSRRDQPGDGPAREPGRDAGHRSPPAWSGWPGRWSPSSRCR